MWEWLEEFRSEGPLWPFLLFPLAVVLFRIARWLELPDSVPDTLLGTGTVEDVHERASKGFPEASA